MMNPLKTKEITDKLDISKEAEEKMAAQMIEGLSIYFIHLLGRLNELSKWCLAGSITATFTVLVSLTDLKLIYTGANLKWFLGFQVASIVCGVWFQFLKELDGAISKRPWMMFDVMLTFINSIGLEAKEKHGLTTEQLETEFLESYKLKAPTLAWKVFKSSVPGFIQVGLLLAGLFCLIIGAFGAL